MCCSFPDELLRGEVAGGLMRADGIIDLLTGPQLLV